MSLNVTSRALVFSASQPTATEAVERQATPANDSNLVDAAPRGDLLSALIASQPQHPVGLKPDAVEVKQPVKSADAVPRTSDRSDLLSVETAKLAEKQTETQNLTDEAEDRNKIEKAGDWLTGETGTLKSLKNPLQ